MRRFVLVSAVGAFLASGTPLLAVSCDDLVVDNAHVFTDMGKVTAAAKALADTGYDVRVRTFPSLKLGNQTFDNVDAFERAYRQTCSSWLSGGLLRNRMFLLIYANEKGSIGPYMGTALEPRKDDIYSAIRGRIVPGFKAYRDRGEQKALGDGFAQALYDLREPFGRSSTATPPPVVINQAPSDYSGFVSFLKWLLVLGAAAVVGVLIYRFRSDKGDSDAAQAQATAARSRCLNRLLPLTDPKKAAGQRAMIDALGDSLSSDDVKAVEAAFDSYKSNAAQGLAALTRFDDPDRSDPNVKGLSERVYRSNEQAYEDILAQFVEPAEAALKTISELLGKAKRSAA